MPDITDTGYTDDYGNPIYIDSGTGNIIGPDTYGAEYAGVAPSPPILDPQYQDYGTGHGVSYVTTKGQPIAVYVENAPQVATAADVANGLDIGKLIVDSAGKYWRYIQQGQTGAGQMVYTRQAVSPASNTGIYLALAALAMIALT